MVENYKRLPRGLLYENLPASNTEIDRQVEDLANRGAIQIDNDHIAVLDTSRTTVNES